MGRQVRSLFNSWDSLMRIKAGHEVVPHVDGEQYGEWHQLFFHWSRTKKYAPFPYEHAHWSAWVLLCVQHSIKHGVTTNMTTNLQLWFDMQSWNFLNFISQDSWFHPKIVCLSRKWLISKDIFFVINQGLKIFSIFFLFSIKSITYSQKKTWHLPP